MGRLIVFLFVVWCASKLHAELLALYPGSPGSGLVARFDPATGAEMRPFGHDNEGLLALCVDAHNDIYVSADILGAGLIYRFDRAGRLRAKVADVNGTDFSALAIGP